MLRTPLHDLHVGLGAKMVEFAGWEMPLLYRGIVEEHQHTRTAGSVFDVSHMGRLWIRGEDAEWLLQHVCTRQLGDAASGQARYSMLCNERGGILDDIIVYRYDEHWMVVCNASNRAKVVSWLETHAKGRAVEIEDATESTLMVAIQGPLVMDKLQAVLPMPIGDLKRYRFTTGDYMFVPYTIARTGYTGEDGVEIILPAAAAMVIGNFLEGLVQGDDGLRPAGLGARDTLRLEAAMPLYGHELDEKIDPLTAGQAWCVDLKKDFVGADALRTIASAGPAFKLVGLELAGKRIGRQGMPVSQGESKVGRVTSGTFSPTLQKSIAMALVAEDTDLNKLLSVELGSQPVTASVRPLPFYKRKS